MCRFISFFHRPANGDLFFYDLESHSNTEAEIPKGSGVWREGHYTPDGKIECRVTDEDRVTNEECNERLRNQFPTFIEFFNMAVKKVCDEKGIFKGNIDLSSLTSAKDLVLPESIGGGLDLSSLTSAKDLVLPKSIGGWLDLSSLTSEERDKIKRS